MEGWQGHLGRALHPFSLPALPSPPPLPCPPLPPHQLEDWLVANLAAGARVGIDPWVHTVNAVRTLTRKLEEGGKVCVGG
jgi:hypothetical protein